MDARNQIPVERGRHRQYPPGCPSNGTSFTNPVTKTVTKARRALPGRVKINDTRGLLIFAQTPLDRKIGLVLTITPKQGNGFKHGHF